MPPDPLDAEARLGLRVNLTRCHAQKRIEEGRYDRTDYVGVYDLFMRAYGDEPKARQAQAQAAEALVNQQTEAARAARR